MHLFGAVPLFAIHRLQLYCSCQRTVTLERVSVVLPRGRAQSPPRSSALVSRYTERSGRAQLPGTSTTTQNSRVLLAVHCDAKRYARCFEDRTTIAVALPHEPRRRFYVTKSWGRALACSSSQIASEVGRLVLVACKSFETIYRAPYAAPVVLLSLMRAKVGA